MNPEFYEMVEVVLITYNRAGCLEKTLEQLLRSPIARCRLTVIDNASPDATPAVCAKYAKLFPDFVIRRNRFNVGISGNYLRALEAAEKEFAWFLCDDDHLDFTHFDEIVTAVTSRKFDIVFLGVPNHTVLPRGTEIRAQDLIRDRRFNYFYTASFIPCIIFRTANVTPEVVLSGYYKISTILSNLCYFVEAVRRNSLIYVCKNDFIFNQQDNVGYRPLHFVVGWINFANGLRKKPQDKPCATAMMHEMLGRSFYPQKIAQYTLFQKGFANQNTGHDAWRLAVESFKAGPIWFLKVLPFVIILLLPGFISRKLWQLAEKLVKAREGRQIKRPTNIEFAEGKDYRG
ncbi:MAG: glycosyltransferase family 2 protein [Verrucomicrobiales bacterium]|nr:glycosyltransferase family 2 protein [Verrucomicrobiales bacterium]